MLDRLAGVLENDLGAAETVLAELRSGVAGGDLEPVVDEIAAKVDIFAIDDAQALLVKLRRQLTNPA
jgi:hypothetical protein